MLPLMADATIFLLPRLCSPVFFVQKSQSQNIVRRLTAFELNRSDLWMDVCPVHPRHVLGLDLVRRDMTYELVAVQINGGCQLQVVAHLLVQIKPMQNVQLTWQV